MRTLWAVALALALLSAACGDDDKSPSAPTQTPASSAPQCSYAVAPAALALAATGSLAKGTIALTTTSACSWTAAANAGWLTVTPSTGSGNQSLAVVALDNAATAPRTAAITVGGQSVAVTQAGSGK